MWYPYDLSLLEENRLKTFSDEIHQTFINLANGKGKDKFIETNLKTNLNGCEKFKNGLFSIYDEYRRLTQLQKNYYKKAFETNHKLEKASKGTVILITYEDLKTNCSEKFKNEIKKFFEYIYDELKDTVSFKNSYILPLKYYQIMRNKEIVKQVCPFCGMSQVSMEEEDYREDFDHYLAKSIYPFLSLDYKNLVPMCTKCNQKYKKDKDISSYNQFFYPFDTNIGENKLVIQSESQGKVTNLDIKNEHDKIDEINTWDNVFKIKTRSASKINESFKEMIDEVMMHGIEDVENSIVKMLNQKNKYKYNGLNIFNISILEYFKNNKYFDKIQVSNEDLELI